MGRRLLVLALLSACGGAGVGAHIAPSLPAAPSPPPLAATPAVVGLHPGEQMTFEITMAGVLAGNAALAVGQPGEVAGRRAIEVKSAVSSAGAFRMIKVIEDDLTSTIDLDTGLTFAIVADVQYGDQRYHAIGRFDHEKVDLQWDRGDGHPHQTHMNFGSADAVDAHSAMAAMRTWDGKPGESRELYVVGGKKIWKTEATWVGPELIASTLGNQHALRLDGVSIQVGGDLQPLNDKKARSFSVWMSDDADRVPLRVVAHTELGDVEIVLTGYQHP